MKRYIILLLFCLATGSYIRAQNVYSWAPESVTVDHGGGEYSSRIVDQDGMPVVVVPANSMMEGVVSISPPQYNSNHIESIVFLNVSQFKITFKTRPHSGEITGKISFTLYVNIKDGGNIIQTTRTAWFFYTYPAIISVYGGKIAGPDKEYKYGETPSRIRSLVPGMTSASRGPITYQWQKKSSAGSWLDMPGGIDETCLPDKMEYTSAYYRRAANDGYSRAYSNEVEIRAVMNAGTIGISYTDSSETLTLTNERTPSVEVARCSWEKSTDLNNWSPLSGTGYSRTIVKPASTTYYRRVVTSLDGEEKSYSNTVCYSLSSPVYITTKTATNPAGTGYVEDRAYYDGLGRPAQTVSVGAAPTGKDLVSVAVYDNKGRQADSYLPFAVAGGGAYAQNALYKQDEYYKTKFGSPRNTLYPYIHSEYDSSPLDRVVKTTRPGAEYRQGEGHSIHQEYGLNKEGEVLRISTSPTNPTSVEVLGNWPVNALYKTSVTNEDGAVNETFTDHNARTVLSRRWLSQTEHADTYYVYDALERLAWVISPEGSVRLEQGTPYAIDSPFARKYCFRYIYDGSGNVSRRYIPGREVEYASYDNAGRIIAMQDGAMHEQGVGLAYRYDHIGRLTSVAMTSMDLRAENPGDAVDPDNPWVIDPVDPGDPELPPITIDPIDPWDPGDPKPWEPEPGDPKPWQPFASPMSASVASLDTQRHYYDTYELSLEAFARHAFVPVEGVVESGQRVQNVRGLKTHEQVFQTFEASDIARPSSVTSSRRTFYYDQRNRLIQTIESTPSDHLLRISYKYDYTGNPLVRYEQYTVGGAATTVRYDYCYDHRGRITCETVTVNGIRQTQMTTAYDELGQLQSVTTENGFRTSYTYNIQGWLTGKSTDKRLTMGAASSPALLDFIGGREPGDGDLESHIGSVFNMELKYFDPVSATPLYSGNIAEQKWRNTSTASGGTYAYTYDKLGRLTDSKFTPGGNLILGGTEYGEENIRYDLNTNLRGIDRYNTSSEIKRYEYILDGNRIATSRVSTGTPVMDGRIVTGVDFASPTAYNAAYDSMGNMTYDAENNLHYSYNFINLPENIKRAAQTLVNYTYLWDGTKVRALDDSGRGYEYIGSLRVARNGTQYQIESIPFAGGRIVATSSGFEPKYYVTDHLGSTRVIVNQNGSTSEAVFDYMPYGTQHRVASSPTSDSDFRFTGKELQGLFGLDELYDSAARFQSNNGRFLSPDPLAGNFPWCSPYTYCAGNPINLIDPDGREFTEALEEEVKKLITAGIRTMQKNIQAMGESRKRIASGELTEKQVKREEKKIAKLDQNNREIVDMSLEINALSNSNQLYDIQYNATAPNEEMNYTAGTMYNKNTDAATIQVFDSSRIGIGGLAHEMKHLYQFETGRLSYNKESGQGGYYYDYQDEVEAHRRGGVFGGRATPDPLYKTILKNQTPGPIPAVVLTVPQIVNTQIFRIKSVTYK